MFSTQCIQCSKHVSSSNTSSVTWPYPNLSLPNACSSSISRNLNHPCHPAGALSWSRLLYDALVRNPLPPQLNLSHNSSCASAWNRKFAITTLNLLVRLSNTISDRVAERQRPNPISYNLGRLRNIGSRPPLVSLQVVKPRFSNLAKISANSPTTTTLHSVGFHKSFCNHKLFE